MKMGAIPVKIPEFCFHFHMKMRFWTADLRKRYNVFVSFSSFCRSRKFKYIQPTQLFIFINLGAAYTRRALLICIVKGQKYF